MNGQTMVSRLSGFRTALRAAGVIAAIFAASAGLQEAYAGCGEYEAAPRTAADFRSADSPGVHFMRAGYLKVADESVAAPESRHAAITGLWSFKYISKGNLSLGIPDGVPVDAGNTIWYADGNEVTSSSMRAPNTGSICLGVWQQTGESTYVLNHIGLAWDPVHNAFAGPAFIKQYVTLERGGNAYSGTFEITQLGPDGKSIEVQIKGLIVATRVTLTTDTQR
jgi:hypothetical protein